MSASRPILVGEAPAGSGADVRPALEGRVGRTLARLCGIDYEDYLDRFRRVNLFETPDEGKRWKASDARMRALNLSLMFEHGDRVVLLGRRVAAAFNHPLEPYSFVSMVRATTGAVVWVAQTPHPSGRNRLLNDPRERERFGAFLREVLGERR